MPILAKLAYQHGVVTGTLLFWRFALAALLFALLARRGPPPWRQRVVLWALGAVFIGNALAYFKALETVPATTVSLVVYTYPVIVMLESALLGLESLTVRGLVSALLAFAGCALTAGAFRGGGPGIYYALAYRGHLRDLHRPVQPLCAERARGDGRPAPGPGGGGGDGPVRLRAGRARDARRAGGLGLVLAITILCTVVAMYAFLAGLARVGPGRAAVLSSLEVLVTLVLAYVFLGERLGPRQWAGAVLILGGVVLQNLGRRFSGGRATAA